MELRRLIRTQLHALDPQGYAPELQITRLDTSVRTANTLGRISHFELLEEIGKGGMACVYRGLDVRDGTIVAIKKVRTEGATSDEAAIRREIDIYTRLQQIDNPQILAVRSIFREAGDYALVTEYADGGSLWNLMGGDIPDEKRVSLDEQTAKHIALNILDGLAALHENNIVHRDIKPQNILRCDDVWKIADFGISKFMNNPVTGFTFQGAHTAPWSPPEQIEGAPAHPSADLYAWGRVTAFMLTGRSSKEAISSLPASWRDLLAPCVEIAADRRPDVSTITRGLKKISC